jgi:hypothetical protein
MAPVRTSDLLKKIREQNSTMKQSRSMSLAEVCISTAIGFLIAYVTNAIVMPAFGHPINATDNFWITSIFTVVSIVRGFGVRRLFERLRMSGALT